MGSKRIIGITSVAVVLLMVLAAFAAVPGAAATDKEQKVIVLFKDSIDEGLIAKNNGKVDKSFNLIPAVATRLTPNAMKALKGSDKVLAVELDQQVSLLKKPTGSPGGGKPSNNDGPAQPPQEVPWGISFIGADSVTSDTGAGVNVAILDTGIDSGHVDLAANYKGGYNAINPKKKPNDDNGHGTHVAGTIAGVDNTIGVIGVAPDANLYAVKVLGRSGSGWISDIIEGLDWAVNNDMDVVSMSFGGSSSVQSFKDAIDAAYDAGIVLVAAAGNEAGSVIFPAAYSSVIAVSAIDSSGHIASFSNHGPQVELAAPGVSILSTVPGDLYDSWSGTSMATPHVSGTVALVLALSVKSGYDADSDGSWDPAEVRDLLHATATDMGTSGMDNYYGYGVVDAYDAVTA